MKVITIFGMRHPLTPRCQYLFLYNLCVHRHGKSSRHHLAATRSQKQAVGRCIPSIDTGYSRGSLAKQAIFCLHFARGVCTRGHECMYLHRLPTGTDDAHCALLYDIFGREKHRNEREDNGGTGSYMRSCRTLFVYYGAASTLGGQRLRQLLATSFGEWGAIEDIHIVPSKCISFVRYKFRASAEFAKEAMMGQKMEDGMEDSLVVRWANDDPNMRAQERVKREREDVVLDGIRRAEQRIPPGQRVALRLVRSFERSLETSEG